MKEMDRNIKEFYYLSDKNDLLQIFINLIMKDEQEYQFQDILRLIGKIPFRYFLIKHENKRVSHKVDGVIDMKKGDVIVCSHMYPVICWRKDDNKKFFEYKVLSEQRPYIKNAINIIHISNDEFITTSNSWPSLKFYQYTNIKEKLL